MFKDRALSIQLTRKPTASKDATETATLPAMTPEQIAQIAKDHARNAAVAVAALYVGKAVVDTVRDIALIAARAKFQ